MYSGAPLFRTPLGQIRPDYRGVLISGVNLIWDVFASVLNQLRVSSFQGLFNRGFTVYVYTHTYIYLFIV